LRSCGQALGILCIVIFWTGGEYTFPIMSPKA